MHSGRHRRPCRARPSRRPFGGVVESAVVLSRFAVAVTLMLLCWTLFPTVVGWSSHVVMSGSMTPQIDTGDVVVTEPVGAAAARPGLVVLVVDPADPGRSLLHRVVEQRPDGSLITRGDANRVPDSTPVPPQNVRGIARLRIPYVGLPIAWLRQGRYLQVAATLLALLTVAYCAALPTRSSSSGAR
jgi:signal peptidase I